MKISTFKAIFMALLTVTSAGQLTASEAMYTRYASELNPAIGAGHIEDALAIIAAGVDVNFTDAYVLPEYIRHTALMSAIQLPSFGAIFSEKMNLVAKLIAAGADVNIQDGSGYTALMYAVDAYYNNKHEETAMLTCLLAAGADVNAQDRDGETALLQAASRSSLNAVRLLVKAKSLDFQATYRALNKAIQEDDEDGCGCNEYREALKIVKAEELARKKR